MPKLHLARAVPAAVMALPYFSGSVTMVDAPSVLRVWFNVGSSRICLFLTSTGSLPIGTFTV